MKRNKAKLIGIIISMVCAMSLVAVGVMASLTQFKVAVGNQLNLQFDTVEGSLYATRVGDVASAADRSVSKVLSTSGSGTDWMLIYHPLDQDGDGNNVIAAAQNSIQESVDFSSDSAIAEKVENGETAARITYYFYYTIPSTGSDIIGTKIQLSTPTASVPATGLSVNYAYKKTSDAVLPNFATGYPMQNGDVVSVNAGENIFIKAELVADLTGTVDVSSIDWEFTLKFVVETTPELNQGPIKVTDGTIGGNYYYYTELGEYPQSRVKDNTIKSALDSLSASAKTGRTFVVGGAADIKQYSYDEYKYGDNKYVKVESATLYSSRDPYNRFADGGTAANGNSYWLKVEPIKWFLLEEYSTTRKDYTGSTTNLRVISEEILTANVSFASGRNANDRLWANTNMRNWLNDQFYNSAFSSDDKTKIVTNTTRYNNAEVHKTKDDYTATSSTGTSSDNVWLLSYYEVTSTYVGTNLYLSSTSCGASYTDFAMVNNYDVGAGRWMLRSIGRSDCLCTVSSGGPTDVVDGVYYGYRGVRPAMVISL